MAASDFISAYYRFMRALIAAVAVLAACSGPPASLERQVEQKPQVSVADLEFNDPQLQIIATRLRQRAGLQGVETSSGHNRVERLLSLEASLAGNGLAFQRVNKLVAEMTATDVSQWAKLRQRAEREFTARHDDVGRRVSDMLARWQRRKTEAVFRYLSSNYESTYITSLEWERRFHEFVIARPMDAATWGWLVLGAYADDARQQYGRADAEAAYRFYLEFSGLGDGREARRVFSVPGIEIDEPAAIALADARSRRRTCH
jgi:hypothetical protein